jgi:protein-tyrosine-phosphatase
MGLRVPTILMVCTANQCRSPMAEVLLRDLLQRRNLDGALQVDSAGVWATDGMPATEFAVQAMQARRLDLRGHTSKRTTQEIVDVASVILVMTEGHRRSLQALFPEASSRIHLLTEMAGEDWGIPDPVGGPLEGYLALAEAMAGLLERGWPHLLELAGIRDADEALPPSSSSAGVER